ncbi:pectate lyase [Streptomyces sp. DSM 40750]|uniref:pectate lyase n=1 Tax=Streptomyces sp. DSM 40750 TaxID=2801030 RepID=UPI003FA6B9F3
MSDRTAPRRSRRRRTNRRRSVLVAVLATALTGGAVTTGVLMTASTSGPTAGTYRIINAADDTCLTAPSGGGAQLGVTDCDSGTAAQTWELTGTDGGFVVTGAVDGAECVGVKGAATSAGKAVQAQECDGGSSQVWEPSEVGDAYHLVNGRSGKCLNAKGGLVQQNSCDEADGKSWSLEATDPAESSPAPSASASSTASPSASPSPSASASAATSASPSATAGKSATGSTSDSAESTDSGDSGSTALASWPTATGSRAVNATIEVSGTYDGSLKRFYGSGDLGGDSQDESQGALFELADGAVLKNVVLGAPAADGVHCLGSCTLRNVWWENVGEDAASFKGKSASASYLVVGGGAKGADDKVFQHNGAGTLTVKNFQVADFGKLYRSCGNCETQYRRHVVISNVRATAPGKVLVGVNANYGDTAVISGVTLVGDSDRDITVCERFQGNSSGAEPAELGNGPDGTHCRYSTSDIAYE